MDILFDFELDLISIIVPVYNVAPYIRDCLDSIAAQTYPNLEVLLIDDGSTDQSGVICDQYADQYSYFQVFHQKNQGLSAARNEGLDHMHGKWAVFVDSDDYIHPDMVWVLYKTAVTEKTAMARCNYRKTVLNRAEYVWSLPKITEEIEYRRIQSAEEMKFILSNTRTSVVWGAIYQRCLLDHMRFPVGYNYEDVVFLPEVLFRAKELCWINEEYCVHRQVKSSITHAEASSKEHDVYMMMKKRIRLVQNFFPELKGLAVNRFWSQMMNLYNNYIEEAQFEAANQFYQRLKENDLSEELPWSIVFDKTIPISNRIVLLGCKLSFVKACQIKRKLIH